MKNKSIIAIAALLCLTTIVLLIRDSIGFWDSMSDINVYSGEETIEKVRDSFKWHVPKTATNLYYAHDNGIDIHSFFALTLSSEEECEEMLKLWFNASISDFQKTCELPEKYLSGPGGSSNCPVEYKKNWDISEYNEYYVYDDYDMRRLAIVYVPEHFRIFIFKNYPD